MSLAVRKSEAFLADLDSQFRWYETQAGWDVAWRYLLEVDVALEKLAAHPEPSPSLLNPLSSILFGCAFASSRLCVKVTA